MRKCDGVRFFLCYRQCIKLATLEITIYSKER